jgi:hypothetical protein
MHLLLIEARLLPGHLVDHLSPLLSITMPARAPARVSTATDWRSASTLRTHAPLAQPESEA